MASTDMTLLQARDNNDGAVIAQYLVTKITFWGSYRRILTVTATHLELYNPDDFSCTNQWFLTVITDVEIAPDPDQFVLVFEKIRFQADRLRFHCHARSHFVALLHKLRRQFSFMPLRIRDYDADRRQEYYQCSEHYADDSYDYFLMQVGVSGVSLLDENGRKDAKFPYLAIQRIATSSAHPDALVISTLFEERLFLCHPRNECIDHMCAAAQTLGITLTVGDCPLNMQLLRLRNSQTLDNPAVVCFDVIKSVDDGKIEHPIQLIFQGVAMIEVHRKLRTIITRPYSMLVSVVAAEWDTDTVILQFVQSETLVVRVESRDQFIAILLLVCREAGNEQVELCRAPIKKSRLFHPHATEHVQETAGVSMESFFLRRILRVLSCDTPVGRSPSPLRTFGEARHDRAWTKGQKGRKGKRGNMKRRRGLHSNAVMIEARLRADVGITLNDHIDLSIALEELNANIALTGFSDSCDPSLLNKAIEVLVEHLISQATSLRSYIDAPVGGIVTALQALTRMVQNRHAFFAEDMVPPLFDAMHEVISRRHFLTSYWALKLLQRYFEPRKSPQARVHRAKALETFIESRTLLYAILDIIPAASSLSRSSSGRWMRAGSETARQSRDDDSEAYLHQDLDQTLLFTKEERLEKDMSIVTYEALFTLHHVLIFLLAKERQEGEKVVTILSKSKLIEQQRATKPKDWTETINLDVSEYDLELHENNLDMATAAKREIGAKLLSKYKFLMDSVVDVRLARSCQTIVALINFLVNFFSQELSNKHVDKASRSTRGPPGGFVLYEDERADPAGTVLYQVGSDTEYRRKRETLPLRRSFLDDITSISSTEESETKIHERKLNELYAFLECYQADVATLDDRSRLFPEQNTILIPLFSFSHASSTESSSNSFFGVSAVSAELARLKEKEEDFLTLDQLRFDDEEEEKLRQRMFDRRVKLVTPAEAMISRKQSARAHPQSVDVYPDVKPTLLHPDSSSNSEDISTGYSRTGRSGISFVPGFMTSSNYRRLDDSRMGVPTRPHQKQITALHDRQKSRDQSYSDRGFGKAAKQIKDPHRRPPRTRPASISIDDRISAHTCDACIACNDVCENKNCVFCAEKQYQLEVAFSESSLPRSPTSATLSSSLNADRKYSSCEVRRHQSARSCWVIVFGFVYDVTDLLSSHPGGMNVLLKAAAVGKDMGDLFVKKHPPHARRVLENYFLGEFYHCENRTVLV